ncbi:YheC/YheD family protein [Evansella sp. LMS18]|uniref:YheC/YheD family protein n=1 Tax=Evansella sp. LMS18 TaxID=2924033 RepID=UPI0020D1F10B|nr:YheC/YheD family protein [Evansella sp. LMS18]UTR11458.1 YheC/YheD family protein [Evansella sp. LMS18]
MEKPYLGIIYSRRRWKRVPKAKGKLKKQLKYIEQAGRRNGVKPCFVRLSYITPGQKTIKAYVKEKEGYILTEIPCPAVFYNRIVDWPKRRKKIEKLLAEGKVIFNVRNYDYGKYPIWKLLAENSEIAVHLPDTKRATVKNINKMMKLYDQLILKPNLGEVGKGVMSLVKQGEQWQLSYKDKDKNWTNIHFKKNLPDFLKDRIKKYFYLVQERIPLEKHEGEPFDIRVVVQRNKTGNWETTAFIGKVAHKGRLITNITQGGYSIPLEHILGDHPYLSSDGTVSKISNFAIKTAEYLSTRLPHIGDLGMDIGITADGTPFFIEVNYLSDYETLSFRKDKLITRKWKRIYMTPIEYGAYLLQQQENS